MKYRKILRQFFFLCFILLVFYVQRKISLNKSSHNNNKESSSRWKDTTRTGLNLQREKLTKKDNNPTKVLKLQHQKLFSKTTNTLQNKPKTINLNNVIRGFKSKEEIKYAPGNTNTTSKNRNDGFLVQTQGCTIPDINPWDQTIQQFIDRNVSVICNKHPSITYTSGNVLKINHTVIQDHYPTFSHCGYRGIYRVNGNDDLYVLDKEETYFTQDEILKVEYIKVQCYDRKKKRIYTNFHAVIFKKKQVENKCRRNTVDGNEKLNIILLGVDSVSRLNFIRLMPKTKRYIDEELNGFELAGYNKVGDNTFPNLVALLSGKFVEDLPWNSTTDRGKPFDRYEFIFKTASKKGYRTLFAEDAPIWGLFNYHRGGFKEQPSDYYLRPFNLALEDEKSVWHRGHCVGDRYESDITLNYLYDYIDAFKDRRHFAFTFNSRLTHNDVSLTGVADDIYLNFFKRMKHSGNLNNSVLLFFSDHGIRWGDIRTTNIGKLEERLPFLYWIFPKWFSVKNPELVNNLKTNKHRLSTPFDIYQTLQNILTDGPLADFSSEKDKKGISLFKVIPESRTCDDASILPHWCTCHNTIPVSVLDPKVKGVTDFIIHSINKPLSHLQKSNLCAILSLDKIIKAEKTLSTNEILQFKSADGFDSDIIVTGKPSIPVVYYQIQFSTYPGGGLFEATVRYSEVDDTYEVSGPTRRLNQYGKQSACIKDAILEKYCYCIKNKKSKF